MRRKLIRQGNDSYTLTLPIKWIRKHNLSEQLEIDILENESELIVTVPESGAPIGMEVEVDLKGFSFVTVRGILNQLYRFGFDRISFRIHDDEQRRGIRVTTNETLLGFEIIDENAKRCIIQNITEPSEERFEVILRRLFLNIKQEGEEIKAALESGRYSKADREERRLTIDRFTNFLRRTIVRKQVQGHRRSYGLFYLCSLLSLYAHSLYYMHTYLIGKKGKASKNISHLFTESLELFERLYQACYKENLDLIEKINSEYRRLQRKELLPMLEKSKGKESVLLHFIGEQIRLVQMASTPRYGLMMLENPDDGRKSQ